MGRCRIDSQSWRSCRYCCFQKCLSAGINPKWVMNDAEKRRRAERLVTIRRERVRTEEAGREGCLLINFYYPTFFFFFRSGSCKPSPRSRPTW